MSKAGRPVGREEPLVSILVPTYDRPRYLPLTLASAAAQTLRDTEIIVHDNASPSDPAPIVESFGDARMALYRNRENLGVTRNLIAGLARCRGKYVAILGDDDLWHPEFLETLVRPLEEDPSIVLAFCDHGIIDSEGRPDEAMANKVSRRFGRAQLRAGVHRPFDRIALVHRSICIMSGAVLRRADIDWQALPPNLWFASDFYISYLAVRTGKACYFTPQRLASYRYHHGSMTATLAGTELQLQNALDGIAYWGELLRDRSLTRDKRYYEMKLAFNTLRAALVHVRRGEWRRAAAQLRCCWQDRLLRPRIFLSHLVYALRLHRARA